MAYELAQLNVATAKGGDAQGPEMASFWAEVDGVNALADADPGLVWRLQDEATGNAGGFRIPGQDAMIVNLSVWRDVPALHAFVFRSDHKFIMARKGEWFLNLNEPSTVLWWVPKGHRPGVEEAWAALQALRTKGPSAEGFSFQKRFDPPT